VKRKNTMKKALSQIKNKDEYILFAFLFLIIILSFLILKPKIVGDGLDYLNSINFLETGQKYIDFLPNRILTTFGGLASVIFLSKIFRSVTFSWIFINTIFYFLFNFLFYKTVLSIHKSRQVALVSTLFLATNYALISFGLNFLMDMGGWFFYMLSIYLVFKYLETDLRMYILSASISVGVGLLFKEYAVLGVIPIATVLVYQNFDRNSWLYSLKKIFLNSIIPALFAVIPIIILYIFVYTKFHYTYIDWLNTNNERYSDFNKIVEYIKSYGSLLNVLGLIFIGGLYYFFKQFKYLDSKIKLYAVSVILSVLPMLVWPGITQRVLFVSVPVITIISSFFIKRFEDNIYFFTPLLLVYFLINIYMDSFILNYVNLPF